MGLKVKKSGMATGVNTGTIQQINVTAKLICGLEKIAIFSDQLMASAMSQNGDSGAVVLTEQNQVVGLIFAGSTNSTLMNRIQNVFAALQVTV